MASMMRCYSTPTGHQYGTAVSQRWSRRRYNCRRIPAVSQANVLVVGSGGREHALCWKLAQSQHCNALYCSPGNAGIYKDRKTRETPISDISNHGQVIDFCEKASIDVVVIGPEVPLVSGLADDLRDAGILAFGPSKAAAQLEGSKTFMKDLCKRYRIPTGSYEKFTDAEAARDYVRAQGVPIVVKADGLAAGKGAIICQTATEAEAAIDKILVQKSFGSAGATIIIEEFLDGEEASYFGLVDGSVVLPLTSAQDHKAVGEGDVGENTGGMGAYSPAPVVTPAIEEQICTEILQPTASAMVKEGMPFRGILFAGLMIRDKKVDLLEYNVRFGDPECQCLMMRMESDLLELVMKTSQGKLHEIPQVRWKDVWALTVVMASKGYPGAYTKGTRITNLHNTPNAQIFHAGTALDAEGHFISNGGRVLGITSCGDSVTEAQNKAYSVVDQISWPEGFCRRDIGWRAIKREKSLSS